MAARCPRCLELEEELERLRQRLASLGQYVTPSPGPNLIVDVERELARWLAVNPRADASTSYRAGWARVARSVAGPLREWEARWWRLARENDRLRSELGVALAELSRLTDRG